MSVQPSISIQKIERLIVHLRKIVTLLEQSRDLSLHQNIDQSFYMQKLAELNLIKEQIRECPTNETQQRASIHYICAFLAWRRDRKKISQTQTPQNRPIL